MAQYKAIRDTGVFYLNASGQVDENQKAVSVMPKGAVVDGMPVAMKLAPSSQYSAPNGIAEVLKFKLPNGETAYTPFANMKEVVSVAGYSHADGKTKTGALIYPRKKGHLGVDGESEKKYATTDKWDKIMAAEFNPVSETYVTGRGLYNNADGDGTDSGDGMSSNTAGLITAGVGLTAAIVGAELAKNANQPANIVAKCGSRPFFIGKKRDEWNKCAASAPALPPVNMPNSKTSTSPGMSTGAKLSIAAAVVLGLGAMFMMMKSRQPVVVAQA